MKKPKDVRIGVYTICKNESKFVRQWIESMYCDGKGADIAYILDTGSTDETIELFESTIKSLKIPQSWLRIESKKYDTFRFDEARNDNLKMVKDSDKLDVLVSVDLDETMIPDFWKDLRDVVAEHPDFGRIYYRYAWNHDEDGNPKRVFWYDKVHPVKNCIWKHPVHEELVVEDASRNESYKLYDDKIYLHHWMDMNKPRSSYLPLLEIRAKEEPDDIYGMFYLMREYLFQDLVSLKALAIGITSYIKILNNSVIDDYDCLTFFILSVADIYDKLGMKEEAEFFYLKSFEYGKHLRQPYISYARFCAYNGNHQKSLELLDDMEYRIPDKYSTWFECDYNWTWLPRQIEAIALCWQGRYTKALKVFEDAENQYIKTPTDVEEARMNGFYDDYNWVKTFLQNHERG